MKKVLKINKDDNLVFVGNDDGSISSHDISDFSFSPNIGDEVEIFESDDMLIINKKTDDKNLNSGIVINNNMSQNIEKTVPTFIGLNRVKKWIYILLAIFFGGFGAHHFYSGKNGKGLMYLLFCWTFIPTLLSLVTIIKTLFIKPDADGYIYL